MRRWSSAAGLGGSGGECKKAGVEILCGFSDPDKSSVGLQDSGRAPIPPQSSPLLDASQWEEFLTFRHRCSGLSETRARPARRMVSARQ